VDSEAAVEVVVVVTTDMIRDLLRKLWVRLLLSI
jgi:hypothetical protein